MAQRLEQHEADGTRAATLQRVMPWAIAGVLVLWLVAGAMRTGGGSELGAYDYAAFGALPVSEDGRIKPLDTVARNTLLQLSGKQSLVEEMLLEGEGDDGLPAIVWLAQVIAQHPNAFERPVFRIDDPEVLGLFGKTVEDGKYYSIVQLRPHLHQFDIEVQQALAVPGDERSRFQEHLLGLRTNIDLVRQLLEGVRPYMVSPSVPGEDWQPLAEPGLNGSVVLLRSAAERDSAVSWAEMVMAYGQGNVAQFNQAVRAHAQTVRAEEQVWAGDPGTGGYATWIAALVFLLAIAAVITALFRQRGRRFAAMGPVYKCMVVVGLCVLCLDVAWVLLGQSGVNSSSVIRKSAFEQGFNVYRPFAKGIVLYTLAGLIGLLGLLFRPMMPEGWYRSVWRSGVGVLVVAFVLHSAGLLIRMWLQGRPPVTNLYSSAVFIGWAVVGFSITMEVLSRLGIASLASSIVGVSTLFIAHNLAKDGDTMGVMQAVLDSNFWLGTHVITVTLGYAATFFAGFLALLYIILGMATPLLDKKSSRLLVGMVYGTVCFALLFSFVGTVLGGIWADQSWGRFWGWDPKENGAVMIVLMNAITLHARWGHLVRERGIMCLAVMGNIITAWSWFGTNLLGVGLHSYGFMDGAMQKLLLFAVLNLLVIAVALTIPTRNWLSFRQSPYQRELRSKKASTAS